MKTRKNIIAGVLSLVLLLLMTFAVSAARSAERTVTIPEEAFFAGSAVQKLNTEETENKDVITEDGLKIQEGEKAEAQGQGSASVTQPASYPEELLSGDIFDSAEASYLEAEEGPSVMLSSMQPGTIARVADIPLDQINEVYYTINSGEQPAATGENRYGAAIVANAQRYLGVPYVAASADPSVGFDCSGFVSYVYNHTGISVASRSCSGIFNEVQRVSVPSMGDIVFFVDPETRSRFTHVGIYIGDNKMIHAGTSGICYTDLSISYWQPRIYGYGRIVPVSEDAE